MNEEYLFFTLAICLPLTICGATGVTYLCRIRSRTYFRAIIIVLSCLPIIAAINNGLKRDLRLFNNDIETAFFYLTCPLILLTTIITVLRSRENILISDYIALGLTIVSSGWLAVFVYLMRQLP